MFHHSTTDYRVAASQAAARAREKFEAMIEKGRATGEAVFNQVHSQVPVDRVVRAERLKVRPDVDDAPGKFDIILPGIDPQPLHPHALRQVAEKAGMHGQYLTNLIKIHQDDPDGDWPAVLVANNLNTLLAHSRSRNLVRSVNSGGGEEVRGFLSDAFRRLDSRPLLDAFVEACQELGAVPVEGFALDTRVKLRAVLPHVFEPADNEVMLFGVEWSNSDFGAGGHTLSLFNTRIWCTNTAVMDEALRQVHLGRRLEDNIAYSQRTYDLDNRTNASALKDVVRDTLSPERVNGYPDRREGRHPHPQGEAGQG